MNKHVVNFKTNNNLLLEGKIMYGTISDFQVWVKFDTFAFMALTGGIIANFEGHEQEIKKYMDDNKKTLKVITYNVNKNMITFGVAVMTVKVGMNNIQNVIMVLTEYLKNINILPSGNYCPVSSDPLVASKQLVRLENEYPIYVNLENTEKFQKMEEAAIEEYNNAPNNYGKGTLGALGGSAVGMILTILVGFTGIISGWVSVFTAYLAGFGYKKMGGKDTKIKWVIISLIVLVMVVVSVFIVYLINIRMEMNDLGVSGSVFEIFSDSLYANKEYRNNFIQNMAIALMFGVIGLVAGILNNKKNRIKK